ncbi:patatin-like phospholipase domain-containing protein 2 isoform X1 [Zingiber officinale]|uniref:PNPLA domain-containing protein n=1 Tax=Zingiber officinale TaxID=94328 RepID=A0A8J5KYT5_ZINOF|nr:patatin-like phospholipase domain-containing protein 2 isoform X1 [Zingiber officinale]KAG6495610.1 hypothetical protein ZIOFF_043436 [Zingiber officinale]
MPCVSAGSYSMFCLPSSSRPLLPRSSSLRLKFHGSSHPHLSPSAITFLLPNPQRRVLPPIRHITHARTGKRGGSETSPPPPSERKSLAVATGELFLGLASLLIRNRGGDAVTEIYVHDSIGKSSDVVTEDSDVIWEQRAEDVEAEKKQKRFSSPGFSFSAAGLLFPYHLGAAQFLLENGYIKETTPLAGSSAGAVVCAVIASGKSMQEALIATKILAEDCRLKGTAFRLGAVLRGVLNTFLPEDVHTRSNGRIRVAITQLLWRPKGLLVDHFDSKEDLIDAVFTSSFIPGYLAPRPATLFRNRLCIDGGLTLFMPPTSAAKTVRVCAFPANRLGLEGIGISPDCNPDNRATPRQLFNWALEPADDCILDNLYELGYLDASVWAEQNPLSTGEEQRNQNATT